MHGDPTTPSSTSDLQNDGYPSSRQVFGGPEFMDDASTQSLKLVGLRDGSDHSAWIYYRRPVYTYLRALGCPEQDLEDLTHEILIKLHTSIIHKYNPERPFRPYLKTAIRHTYFNHLRDRKAEATAHEPAEDLAAPTAEEGEALLQGLVDYARQIYDRFAREAPPGLALGVTMMQAWLMEGLRQQDLSARFQLTDRQVRTHLSRAADAITAWMRDRVNNEDLEALDHLARGRGLALDLRVGGLRDLFQHLSKDKRLGVLLILQAIHRRQPLRPA